ncbi:MAG: beta-glucosidase [Thermoleophilaceae bacterium]|nr:beta-glucosidase [Thermoleophilaceae bacterium]
MRIAFPLLAVLASLLVLATPATAAGRCGNHPWCDTALSPDARADLLLNALTPPERISLLGGDEITGVAGGDHKHTGTSDGVPRVDLPSVYLSDGPVGPRQGASTGLPIPMALAATWDPSVARRYGGVVANEAKFKGNDIVYAPTVNIMRTPLGGRTFEGFGEDPLLVARTGVAWIEGAQDQGVIANVKHFAANNQEGYLGPAANDNSPSEPVGGALVGGRMTVSVEADERTLREIYLPQFEAAVKEGNVGSVMCSYNRLRGQYACENQHLLNDVLKGEWGFKGLVLADYGATHSTAAQLSNGLDFEPWPGYSYGSEAVTSAVASGQATQAQVDEHVHRILRTLFAYGFFDRDSYRDDDAQIDKEAHALVARDVEESAITLLENRGSVLPINPARTKSIAVIGSDSDSFKTGGGSANIKPFNFVSPLVSIRLRAGSGTDVRYDDGSDAARAAAVAKGADTAIVFASDYQSEGLDRYCLTLECPNVHGDQDALIEQVAAANPNTVVVLETGGPVLTPWRDRVKGLVEAWYPGAQAGPALARVLFGDADPGGRLPATFPRSEADEPVAGDPEAYPGVGEQVHYKEGVLVGYRWFDAKDKTPAYPFGFGRSYTSFAYSGLHVRGTRTGASVSVLVRNTGKRAGVEVPQLYLGLPEPGPGIVQPPRQLRGYTKIELAPGKSRRVSFRVDERGLSYWDEKANGWRVADGCYGVEVGRSSRDVAMRGNFAVGGATCPKVTQPPGSGSPAPSSCRRSSVRVHLRGVRARDVRRVTVYVNGKRQRTLRGPRSKVGVRLPGRKGSSRVVLSVRTRAGRTVKTRVKLANCKSRSARGHH